MSDTSHFPAAHEFHISLRVNDLALSTDFYTAFFGVAPKDRTARFSTFIVPHLHLNLVLLVNDRGETLDTYSLYHLGLGVADKAAVIAAAHSARRAGADIVKPPRTTWRGTPLHELWLRAYARRNRADAGRSGTCLFAGLNPAGIRCLSLGKVIQATCRGSGLKSVFNI
jgi:catechol 2,3-dioxygenase-like lactoylglutathione lyase family enzyme